MKLEKRILLSLLWISVMLNMIFADIFSIILELAHGNAMDIPLDVNTMMLIAGVITNIPIIMIVLSYLLTGKANKMANTIAGILTIVYIAGLGSATPHYILIAGIETIMLISIITISWRWKVENE